jgi:acyl-CoA synthetase (AMP-forming)/AMP-acid ligase II
VILLGVTHALLRFAERYPEPWDPGVMVMETGGMKGHGPELIREDLHQRLQAAWGLPAIHAEYGMTELFSQAYAPGDGRFVPSPTLRATVRDIHDPFHFPGYGRSGLLCFTDLANFATQCFIATQDLGRVYEDGRFEVLGRLDGSEVRGCNLLVQDLGRMG